jgi:hypothetical protein
MYVVRNRVLPPTDQNLCSLLVLKRPRRKSRQCPSESSQSKCMFNLPDAKKTGLFGVAIKTNDLSRECSSGRGSSDKLGMRGRHNNLAPLAILNLVNVHLGKRKASSHPLGDAFNLDLLADLRAGLVGDVDIDAHAGLLAKVPGRDGHAAGPVHDGGAHGAVQRLAHVHVVFRQGEAREHQAFACVGDADGCEQEVVDGGLGEFGRDEVLDVSVLGGLGGHDGGGDDGRSSDDSKGGWRGG